MATKKTTVKKAAPKVAGKAVKPVAKAKVAKKPVAAKKVSAPAKHVKPVKVREYSRATPNISNNTWQALLFAILFSMIAGLSWWAYQAHQIINDLYDGVDSSVQDQIDRDTYLFRKDKKTEDAQKAADEAAKRAAEQ